MKYNCATCGAALERLTTKYIRCPIDEETGDSGEPYEENIPGESSFSDVQCSEDPEHETGYPYTTGGDLIES